MGLHWMFKSPRKKLILIDMTIQVKGEKIVTTIYAKPLALFQYIPLNSCHPSVVPTSLILCQILCIYQLCSHSKDIDRELSLLHTRPLNCGYTSNKLLPLFKKGINNAIFYLSQTPEQWDATKKTGKSDKQIFLHIPYYAQKPSSGFVQNIWQNLVHLLPGKDNLNQLTNWERHHVPIKRFYFPLPSPYPCKPQLLSKTSVHTG
jgi:hypothetical protein